MPSQVIRSGGRNAVLAKDRQLRLELTRITLDIGEQLAEKHRQVTRNWSKRIRFTVRQVVEPGFIGVEIVPAGRDKRIWRFVDKGTHGPYIIRAKKRGGMLAFRTGYQPKTAPVARVLQGGKATGKWVKKVQVIHPGIRPRKFTKTFDRELRPEFRRQVNNAIRRAMRR